MSKKEINKTEEMKKLLKEEEAKKEVKKTKRAWVDGRTLVRGRRALRLRRTKNFAFWLTGVFSSIALLLAGVFIAIAILPVSVYFGGKENAEKYLGENLASKSFLSNVQNVQSVTLNDVPALNDAVYAVVDTVNGIFSDAKLLEVDEEELSALGDKKLVGNDSAMAGIFGCIKLVATMDSFGLDLGSLGDLDIMDTYSVIEDDEDLEAFLTTGEKVGNPKLYYYDQASFITVAGMNSFSTSSLTQSNYIRAFNDDGELDESLKSIPQNKLKDVKFYYPALKKVPIGDLLSVFGVRFNSMKVKSILEAFSGEMDEDNPIVKILGDKSISDMGDLNENSIKMVDFIDPPSDYKPEIGEENYQEKLDAYEQNRKIYEILLDCSGKTAYEDITFGDLTSLDMDGVKLSSVIEAPSQENPETNKKLYDVLIDATGKASYDDITIGDMDSFNMDGVKLSTVIEVPTEENGNKNKKLYDVLLDATGKASYDDITIEDMNGFDMDGVKLVTVIEAPSQENPTKNKKLYDVLLDATGKTSYGDITIADMNNFNMDNVKLVTVIEAPSTENPTKNKKLYEVLLDATGKATYDEITIADMNNFDMDKVKMVTVIEAPTAENSNKNKKLYDVLLDATGKESYSDITIADMNNFDMDNVKLLTVVPGPTEENPETNKKLYNMLLDITGKTAYDKLLVGDMANIDIDKAKLVTVINAPTSDNPEDGTAYSVNRKLFDVLMDATGNKNTGYQSYSVLKIGDLNSFDMDKVNLKTVMNSSENKIIQALLNSDDPNDDTDNVTIGNMSEKINQLDVETVYDKHCFTSDPTKAVSNAVKYYLTIDEDGKKIYSIDSTGSDGTVYYVDKSSVMWLFLEYTAEGVDYSSGTYVGTGIASKYVDKHLTVGKMDDSIGSISSEIMNASVHQLYECGILSVEYTNIKGMKIIDVVAKLNSVS